MLWQIAWSATDIAPRVISDGRPVLLVVSALTSVTWLALALTVWGPRSWRRLRPLAILTDIGALAVSVAVYSLVVPVEGAWPLGTIAAVRGCVVATLLLRPVPGATVATGMAALSGVLLITGPARVGFVDALLETLYAVALATGASVLANGLRRSGRRLAEAHRRLAVEESTRLAREEVARVTAEHERRIHDQVLNTLAAISRGGLSEPSAVRQRCGGASRALRLLVEEQPVTPADAWHEVRLLVDAGVPGWSIDNRIARPFIDGLPVEAAAALGTATAEAVRNAIQHSGGHHLVICGIQTESGWTVTVEDDGRGIADHLRPGLGMTRSIRGAMAGVGGQATWVPGRTGGTCVSLSWAPSIREQHDLAQRSIESETVAVLPGIGPPFLATFLGYGAIVVLAGWSYYAHPWWALGWFALALATAPFIGGVPKLARLLGLTGGPSWSARVIVGIGLAMCTTPLILQMEIAAVDGGSPPIWVTWSSEVALSLLFVTVLLGPVWTVIPVLTMWVLAQGGGLVELVQPGALMLVIAALFAASMRRRAHDYAQASAALIAEQARAQADRTDEVRRIERFGLLAEHTAELLDNVGEGSLDPQDAAVRDACRREERVARSIVRVDREAGPIESLLHDAVAAGRARERFLDADLVGDADVLHAQQISAEHLGRVRDQVVHTVVTSLPSGAEARLTGGWEDQHAVLRLLASGTVDDELWEWVIDDDR